MWQVLHGYLALAICKYFIFFSFNLGFGREFCFLQLFFCKIWERRKVGSSEMEIVDYLANKEKESKVDKIRRNLNKATRDA